MDKETLLKKIIINNQRIQQRIKETKPTKQQLLNGMCILIDMVEEEKDKERNNWTSFIVEKNELKRISIWSPKGKKTHLLENIITQDMYPISFNNKKIFLDFNRKEVIELFKTVVQKQKGIYLFGNMGVGKTFLFNKWLHLLSKQNHKVAWINTSRLQAFIYNCMKKEIDYDDWIQKLSNVDYLFIDDIGAEQVNAFFRDTILFSILNTRMENSKITFFNSNYSLDELRNYQSKVAKDKLAHNKQAERLLERIKSVTIAIKLLGKNRRY